PEAIEPAPRANEKPIVIHMPETLDAIVGRCRKALTDYQHAAYAKQYSDFVERVLVAERTIRPESRPRLAIAVAQSLYKLMAYKDEYEVARLFTHDAFRKSLDETFDGDFTLRFHLAPPVL